VNKFEGLVGTRALNRALRQWITRRSFSMRIENRPHLSTEIARLLVAETGERIPPDDRLDITLGLDELLMNAVEHGNLGITAEEKRQALTRPEGLQQLYQERLADPARAARRVAIDFTEDAAGLEWIITDEGAGFDWRSVPDPTADGNVMDMCGRGIFLCRVFFDELEYRGRGNRVRSRKNVD